MTQFVQIFNVADGSYPWWAMGVQGGVMALGGAALFFGERQSAVRWFAVLWIVAVVCLSASMVSAQRTDYLRLKNTFLAGEHLIVRGMVENFTPPPPSGRGDQKFTVGGEHFSFSDNTATAAYHRTIVRGGVDLRDRCAQIGFVRNPVTRENQIVWLGVGPRSLCAPA